MSIKFHATEIHLDLNQQFNLHGLYNIDSHYENIRLTIEETEQVKVIVEQACRRAVYYRKREIAENLKRKAAEIGAPEAFNLERALAAIEI